jgi:uncharacterized caspase-like protein
LDEGKVSGSGGPYASALAAELVKPGQDHLQLFQNVKEGVFTSTSRQQVPWERNGLLKRIYFGGEAKATKPDAAALSEAAEAWTLVKDTTNVAALDAFTHRFGNTFYGDLAKARLADFTKKAEAAQQDADAAKKKSDEEVRAMAETERQRIAMLQQQETEVARKREVDTATLSRSLQTELKRVGCDPGAVDGAWGTKAKEALREFGRTAKVTLPAEEPTEEALKAVAAQKGRICVLKCGANERERGGRCVANAKPEGVTSKVREERPRATKSAGGSVKLCRTSTTSQNTVFPCTGAPGERPFNN